MNAAPAPAVRSPRPPKEERDALRRAQIVEAARQNVLRCGFHAAPMAQIASAAGMSVGQIYRYFPGKDAIIRAIVEDIIERRLARMATSGESPCTPERLAARTPELDARHAEDAVLMLEITAEATRHAEIAAIVRAADKRSQQQAIAKMLRLMPGLSPAEAAARCEVVAVLIEGTVFRQPTELQADRGALERLYARLLAVLLEGRDF